MKKEAYTNFVPSDSFYTEAPLGEWKALAKRIELSLLHSKRLHGEQSSVDSEIDKLAKDWPLTERERFRHWYKSTYNVKLLASSEMRMKAFAQYAPFGVKDDEENFNKHRQSIVKRIRRLQNELGKLFRETAKKVEWADARYPEGKGKIEAISQALNTVCILLETLQTREVTAAVLIRTAGYLTKIDPNVGEQFKEVIGTKKQFVQAAQNSEISTIAQELKRELDNFHYGTHLRRMYTIYDRLGKLGLTSLQSEVETLIQKNLPDLTGLHKKISEIYTEVLEIPNSTSEDEVKIDETPVKKQEAPSLSTPVKTSADFETVNKPSQNVSAVTPAA